jgi:rhamnosyltransferase
MNTSLIVTVLPTYNPELSLFTKVIKSVLKETQSVIVVDDGSKQTDEIRKLTHGATFISLTRNMGQAHALNVGVKEALELSPDWILILDQDTILEDGAISSLGNLRTKNPNIGIICMRKDVPRGVFIEQRTGVLSGNLVRADIFKSVMFREDFFIDQIGFDFWFKARKAGYRVLGFGGGIGQHEVGRKIQIGNTMIFSEPHERFYYIVRNSTVLLCEGGLPISEWGLQILHWFTSLVIVEGFRTASSSLLWGLADGLFSRLGKRFSVDGQIRV